MNSLLAITAAFGAGAAFTYLFDPDRGRRRRALASDQLASAMHTVGDAADATGRDVRNRVKGTLADLRSRFSPEDVSDEVLVERVRARMGGFTRHARAIDVRVADGRVTLRGPVLAAEVQRLIRGVKAVRGVEAVDNQLEVHADADDAPALQGGQPLTGPRSAFMQDSWSPTARLVAGVAGATLTLYGLRATRRRAV